jgi:hypothetical protein
VILAGQLPCYPAKKDSTNKSKAPECYTLPVAKRLTEGNFTVSGFSWKPDGKEIAFNKQSNPLINSGISSDIVVIDITTKKITTLVSNPTGDFLIAGAQMELSLSMVQQSMIPFLTIIRITGSSFII